MNLSGEIGTLHCLIFDCLDLNVRMNWFSASSRMMISFFSCLVMACGNSSERLVARMPFLPRLRDRLTRLVGEALLLCISGARVETSMLWLTMAVRLVRLILSVR